MNFTVETDHKPLIPLLSTKQLSSLPPRVLRFRLRMDRFDFNINHVPGKHLCTADTLSRSPVARAGPNSVAFEKEIESFVEAVVTTLPASSKRLQVYRDAQTNDPVCSTLKKYCLEEWPAKSKFPPELRPYWNIKSELSVGDNLLLRSCRIVVPKPLQKKTIDKIHLGHLGMQKCQLRANAAVWWPGMSKQISKAVKSCPECVKNPPSPSQPLISSSLPQYPWQKVASDLFHFKGKTYLLCVDYFSRYPEVVKLNNTTSKAVINTLKHIFAHHGIPEILYSDNGPQYSSVDMKEFASAYGFEHITSSPHYPRSNGLAERTVKTIKSLMKKSTDLNLLLLSYRSAPLHWCNLSPSELSMGRRVRTTVPQVSDQLTPQWNFLSEFRKQDNKFKKEQEGQYNRRYRVQNLPELPDNTSVWVTTNNTSEPGIVVSPAGAPRSYIVETNSGQVKRNQQHLTPMPTEQHPCVTRHSPVQTRLRTGIVVRPPDRLAL